MNTSLLSRAAGRGTLLDGAALLSMACLAVLVASRLLPPDGLPGVDLCSFHAMTGLSCPGCGLTRAFCALSRGQFAEAWGLHPFAFPLFAMTVGGLAAPLLNGRFPALSEPRAGKFLRIAVLAFAGAMLLFGVLRAKRQWNLRASARVIQVDK